MKKDIIEERDDMIYGRKPRNEKRIKEINDLIMLKVTKDTSFVRKMIL